MTQFFWGGQRHTDLGALCIVPRPVLSDFVPLRGGWAHTQLGEAYIEEVLGSALPTGAVIRNGMAWTSDGALCVTFSLPIGSDCRLGGWRVREDGVACVTTDAPTAASRYQGAAAYNQQGQRHVGSDVSFFLNGAAGSIIPRTGQAATFTRATTATVTDQDLMVRSVLSGEARFLGLRRVQNLITANSSLDIWAAGLPTGWGKGGTATVNQVIGWDGSGSAAQFSASVIGNVGTNRLTNGNIAFTLGHTYRISAKVRRVSGKLGTLACAWDGVNVFALVAAEASTNWTRYATTTVTAGATSTGAFAFYVETATDSVWEIDDVQLEDVTGQAVQNPAEYVSVGTLATPYHGANVDGVKYFGSYNGNVLQQNLALQSQTFDNASWTKFNSSVTADAIAAPDGTLTADKLVENAANTQHYLQGVGGVTSLQYASSVYAKAAERFILTIAHESGGGAQFNLKTGIATPLGSNTAVMTPVGNGWYRCESRNTVATTGFSSYLQLCDATGATTYQGDSSSGMYLWGFQIQNGRRAGTYVATTAAAVNNQIVEEATGDAISSSIAGGYLVEGARTNLFLRSDNFSATWVLTDTVNNPDVAISPDGLTNADRLDEGVAGTAQTVQAVTATANANYAISGYFKKNTANDWIQLGGFNGANSFRAWFNLNTGVKGSTGVGGTGAIVTSSMTALANGWYRCVVVGSVGSAATAISGFFSSTSADNVTTRVNNASYFGYGLQFEDNVSFASTYIPTTVATATRNTDFLTYPASIINTAAGTVTAEAIHPDGGVSLSPFVAFGTDANADNWPLWVAAGEATTIRAGDGSVGQSAIKGGLSSTLTARRKRAMTYGGATKSTTGDGLAVASNGFNNTVPNAAVGIGTATNGGSVSIAFVAIAAVSIRQQKVTDVQVQALTA